MRADWSNAMFLESTDNGNELQGFLFEKKKKQNKNKTKIKKKTSLNGLYSLDHDMNDVKSSKLCSETTHLRLLATVTERTGRMWPGSIQTQSDDLNWGIRRNVRKLNSLSLVLCKKSSTFWPSPKATNCYSRSSRLFSLGIWEKVKFSSTCISLLTSLVFSYRREWWFTHSFA